jgi:hypothetical protein
MLALPFGDEVEAAQRLLGEFERQPVVARELAQAREPQRGSPDAEWRSRRVEEPGSEGSSRGFEDQAPGEIERPGDGLEVGAALEAVRGVRVHPEAPRSPPDADWVPPGRLEEDVLRLRGDGRVEAAHDAGERHGALGVGHDDVGGRKLRARRRRASSDARPCALCARSGGRRRACRSRRREEAAPCPRARSSSRPPPRRSPSRRAGRGASAPPPTPARCGCRGFIRTPKRRQRRGTWLTTEVRCSTLSPADGGARTPRTAARFRHRGDFPREAPMSHRVGPVRGDLDVQDGVAARLDRGLGGKPACSSRCRDAAAPPAAATST